MRILGIITARGGSKGVPRKNIIPLAGKPLLAWTAEAALAAKGLTRVVLSTDDHEIAEVGRTWGLDVPFMRPPELAKDDTPTVPVLIDVLHRLAAQGERYEAICLLQPTNPLRDAALIDACIETFIRDDAETLLTVLPVPAKHHPDWVYVPDGAGGIRLANGAAAPIARRQELSPAWHREGSIYLAKTGLLLEHGTLYGAKIVGYPVDPERSVNIDAWEDLERTARVLETDRLN